MIISHEVPISLLNQSRNFNDYDYALVHLFELYPEYYNFYKESVKQGRHVLLDNSIFELGESFDMDKYRYWIDQLNPTEYIIPDVLENTNETIKKFKYWISNYYKPSDTIIGVIQGKTYNDLVNCYKKLVNVVDKIAISFDYSYYEREFPNEDNKFISWMKGRQKLIDKMIKDEVISYNKKHHLLGIGLPQEIKYYKSKKYKFITSIDTSNPVVHAIKNIKYNKNGLDNKNSIKLVDLINTKYEDIDQETLLHNLHTFRGFINE